MKDMFFKSDFYKCMPNADLYRPVRVCATVFQAALCICLFKIVYVLFVYFSDSFGNHEKYIFEEFCPPKI